MVRNVHKLTALAVRQLKAPGLYSDGGGLYLLISSAKARSWLFRFSRGGKAAVQGLGSAQTMTLAEAREAVAKKHAALAAGLVPVGQRAQRRKARAVEAPKTFKQCALDYFSAHSGGWGSSKHHAEWRRSLEKYIFPVFGDRPVGEIDLALVLRVLQPIWQTKPETASRTRGRIEAVLDSATVSGYRQGDNPARWRGWLQTKLPSRAKVARVRHHPALPYEKVGAFMAKLKEQPGMPARAFEFLILTATRTSETLEAAWSEFDLANGVWTIPPERIKARVEHRVPLSPAALAVVEDLKKARVGPFVFPGMRANKPLSNASLLVLLRRMGHRGLTVHGFRSTFRDWAAERTAYPREVAEKALAHAVGDKVEAAYRRGDMLDRRRRLMDEWPKHCGTIARAGDVVPLLRIEQ